MTVFKTFWKVVKKYKFVVILYTVMLIGFGGVNMSVNKSNTTFTDSKPDIFIVNQDENIGITKNLIEYMTKNANIVEVENTEEALDDALFYRDISYVMYIPENYRNDVLNKLNPTIDIKTTGDYEASLAEMMLGRYVNIQKTYVNNMENEDEIISQINNTIDKKSEIEIASKIDVGKAEKMASYFNFSSYSIMAVTIFIICTVLSSFRKEPVKKRIIISSMDYKKHNFLLLVSSFIFCVIVWGVYVVLAMVLLGDIVLSTNGILYIINTFVFTICCLSISLCISTVVKSKNAINGIINVFALGSAFLCGAFIPTYMLPSSVLKVAHVLPAYWYINSNNRLKTLEQISYEKLQPILINTVVLLGFTVLFIILNNIISKKKQKIG